MNRPVMSVKYALLFLVFVVLELQSSGQNTLRGQGGGGGGGGKRGRQRRDRPIDLDDHRNDGKLFSALSIMYPLDIFNIENPKNWRSPGVFDQQLADMSGQDKPYMEISRAQDQEDVWLYENWFYGIKDGVIVESGALDGLLFSTSYMFETFANWTAIHVGKLQRYSIDSYPLVIGICWWKIC